MDNETRQMFEIIIKKLDGVDVRLDGMETKINSMDVRLDSMDARLDSMDARLDSMETRLDSMETRLDSMETRLDSMEERQEEMYLIQRGLEENAKVTRAEQDKIIHILYDIQGKVTKLGNEVEDHDTVIRQIRSIK